MKKAIKNLSIVFSAIALCCGMAGCAPRASGTFYSLKEAYEAGYLTYDDVMSIAYYQNGGRRYNESVMDEDYTPQPREPQGLSEKTSLRIRNTAAHNYRNNIHADAPEAVADDFNIIRYYGTYGDCVAVMMTDNYTGYTQALWEDTIADIVVFYYNGNSIIVWREEK